MRPALAAKNPEPDLLFTVLLLPVCLIIFSSCTHSQTKVSATGASNIPAMHEFLLTSPAFKAGEAIPSLYTCDSTNISPTLHWSMPPVKVESFALIMDDPDAPMGVWVHWVVFDIPGTDSILPSHFPIDSVLNTGIKQGITSFGGYGYRGPCPPDGVHHYHFRLFALDKAIKAPCATTGKKRLTEIMKGHIIAEAHLTGTYQRRAVARN